MKSGIVIVDKEEGKTSRDVVNELCKKFQTKKIGHTGTLDPLATGVLVIGINEGTKIIEFLSNSDKEYIAEVTLGLETDTLDKTGKILREEKKTCSREKIKQVLSSFLGSYEQEVPKYSAVHVAGKRLYEYARENQEVKLPKRLVTIQEIELLTVTEQTPQKFTFRVRVSKGTYIRSLIRDIGTKLEIPCCMSNLRRVRLGNFAIGQAKKVEFLTEKDILPLKVSLAHMPQKVIADQEMLKKIKNGAKLPNTIEKDTCFLDEEENLLAIYTPQGNQMKPKKVFAVPKDI